MVKFNKYTLNSGNMPPIVFPSAVQLNDDKYLECDGSTFDETEYPELYDYLGTNVLPDYRETTLVGAGQNSTDTIADHDTYTVGEFKDDAIQTHSHTFTNYPSTTQTATANGATIRSGGPTRTSGGNTGRSASVTRSKSVGVYYYIRTSNLQLNSNGALYAKGKRLTRESADGVLLGQIVSSPVQLDSPYYLECDGSKVPNNYNDLIGLIGDTLPDYREVSLVGAGQNTTNSIASHDVFTVGQFKDDQMQTHTHSVIYSAGSYRWNDSYGGGGVRSNTTTSRTNNNNGRSANVTRDKSKGTYYYIKAVI